MAHSLQQSSLALLLYAITINLLLSLGKSEGYSVNQISYKENGKCVKVVSVTGNGVSDSFNITCTNNDMNSITSNGHLVVGDPQKDNFSLYSDTPNTLVVLENGKCTNKTYTTTGSETTSSSETISDDECTTIKSKMAAIIKENEKYWSDWSKNFTQQIAQMFPPGFPFNSGYNKDSSTSSSSSPWWTKLWG